MTIAQPGNRSPAQLEALRRIDSSKLANAIDAFAVPYPTEGCARWRCAAHFPDR